MNITQCYSIIYDNYLKHSHHTSLLLPYVNNHIHLYKCNWYSSGSTGVAYKCGPKKTVHVSIVAFKFHLREKYDLG